MRFRIGLGSEQRDGQVWLRASQPHIRRHEPCRSVAAPAEIAGLFGVRPSFSSDEPWGAACALVFVPKGQERVVNEMSTVSPVAGGASTIRAI